MYRVRSFIRTGLQNNMVKFTFFDSETNQRVVWRSITRVSRRWTIDSLHGEEESMTLFVYTRGVFVKVYGDSLVMKGFHDEIFHDQQFLIIHSSLGSTHTKVSVTRKVIPVTEHFLNSSFVYMFLSLCFKVFHIPRYVRSTPLISSFIDLQLHQVFHIVIKYSKQLNSFWISYLVKHFT